MPKINVYLPDALASAVKDAGVPVSAVCQAALSEAVERVGRSRRTIAAFRNPETALEALHRLSEGASARMTPRLLDAFRRTEFERVDKPGAISSVDVLRGLLGDDENFAVRLLVSQGVDVEELLAGCSEEVTEEIPSREPPSDGPFVARLSMPAGRVCERNGSGHRLWSQLHRLRARSRGTDGESKRGK